jgi:mRNA interferase RelE/StbE
VNERSWRLTIAGTARRDLERMPEKFASAVVELLPALAASPKRLGKPLRFELEGRWVARRGPYRIIYRLDEKEHRVEVLAVAHRADVYRSR